MKTATFRIVSGIAYGKNGEDGGAEAPQTTRAIFLVKDGPYWVFKNTSFLFFLVCKPIFRRMVSNLFLEVGDAK